MTNVYKILIYNDKTKEYDDYSKFLQLPFNIRECADERYDTGAFTLRKLDKATPFDVETKVKVEIYKNTLLKTSYPMMVEEDRVDTFYIGPRKFYNHTISIIELLKKYDRVFLPDFTITNPGTKTIIQKFEELPSDRKVVYDEPGVREHYRINTDFKAKNIGGIFASLNGKDFRDISFTLSDIPKLKNGIEPPNDYYLQGDLIQLPMPHGTQNDIFRINYSLNINSEGSKDGVYLGGKNYSVSKTYNSSFFTNLMKVKYKYIKSDGKEVDLGYIIIDIKNGRSFLEDFVSYSPLFTNEYEPMWINDELRNVVVRLFFDTSGLNESVELVLDVEYLIKMNDFLDTVSIDEFDFYHEKGLVGPVHYTYLGIRSLYFALNRYYNNDGAHLKDGNISNKLDILDKFTAIENTEYTAGFKALYELLINTEMNFTYNGELKYGDPSTENSGSIEGSIRNIDRHVASIAYNITIGNTNPTLTLKIQGSESYKTVKDLLDKMNTIMKPEDRFILDNTIPDILGEYVPERIYSNRNASEIFFDISSIVSAYPYLDDNNVLTFKRLSPEDNPKYKDKNTEENITYTSENSVNTYMTNISNMINTPDTLRKQYSYWPNKYNFAYSNGNWKNNLITPDTNMIEIQNSPGLYFLKYIKVRNCLNTIKDPDTGATLMGPGTVIDITNYCPELNYYNTLYVKDEGEPSNTNKSNCIYWTKGSNIINLDALETQEKTAIFGDKAPDSYKLQRAIFYAAKSQLSVGVNDIETNINPNVSDYMYQICYVNIMNGMIKNKKFNQDGDNEIVSNFNQMDNNLNAIDWLNSAQINLLRRGNTEISKTVIINDLDNIPLLGEHKFDENNVILYADDINYNFNNNIVSVDINYTKNYNKIDPSVSLDKEYRQFEIYGKEAVTRNINLDRYIYMETDQNIVPENRVEINNSKFNLTGHIKENMRNVKPGYMVLFFKDSEGNPISYYKMTDGGYVVKSSVQGILIPVNTVSSGNNIIIQGELMDNFAAGFHQDRVGDSIKYIDIFGTPKESGARRIVESRYVDDLGEAEYVNMYLLPEATADIVFNPNVYPNTILDESAFKNISFDYEEMIPVKKDNREKLNFVYQIHFLTHDSRLKWNPALCKYFFYDQENVNEMYLDNSGNINTSYKPGYSVSQYDILNDTTVQLIYDSNGKLVIDGTKSQIALYPEIDNNSIGEFNVPISGVTKSIALIYPKTGEIIYHIDNSTGNINIPKIYFKIYK